MEDNNVKRTALKKALSHCQKNNAVLIVAKLDRLSLNIDELFRIKKRLGENIKCCDLHTTDRLTLSIYVGILQRQSELHSIKTKAAFKKKKVQGATFGNIDNLTPQGRKLGLQKIKENAAQNEASQRAMKVIARCKTAGMGLGAISRELNGNGFKTVRGKLFRRATVKRLYEKGVNPNEKT